ncbi:amphi-Trp domain-containing protein [Siminovitchia acidinfaciens]|nr:amphi-Trp domain-containing protein [Siminovitchia acidinfaciens]
MSEHRKGQTNIIVSHKERMPREKAAAMLETIALKLKEEGSFSLHQGEQSHKVEPTENVKVEIELKERNGKYEFEFELMWKEEDESQKLIID